MFCDEEQNTIWKCYVNQNVSVHRISFDLQLQIAECVVFIFSV